MPSELTLYTKDKHWKAEVGAWMDKSHHHRSVGTHVIVYHREHTTSIWGAGVTEWEATPAQLIRIRNVYRGAGRSVATREHEWRNATEAELKEWSMGGPICLPPDLTVSSEGAAVLDINNVQSTVTVVIGNETLSGTVSSRAISEPAPVAA